MAKAQRPAEQKAEEKKRDRHYRATRSLQVDVVDTDLDQFRVAAWNLPMPVRRRIRTETGRPWEANLAEIASAGVDAYALFWWVSRLVAGEDITCAQSDTEWSKRCAGVTLGDIAIEWVTVDPLTEDADPEA